MASRSFLQQFFTGIDIPRYISQGRPWKQGVDRRRSLTVEQLEDRRLLAVTEDAKLFFAEDAATSMIPGEFASFSAPPEGSLSVSVDVYGAFHDLFEVNDNFNFGEDRRSRSTFTLQKNGNNETYQLQISTRPAAEVKAKLIEAIQDNTSGQQTGGLENHWLLSARIHIHTAHSEVGKLTEQDDFYLSVYRFISAIDESETSGWTLVEPVKSDVIPFEQTAIGQYQDKVVRTSAPGMTSIGGQFELSPGGNFSLGWDGQNPHVQFAPQQTVGLPLNGGVFQDQAEVTIIGGYKKEFRFDRKLKLKGDIVVPRTWSLDKAALMCGINRIFPGHTKDELDKWADDARKRIGSGFGGFWDSRAEWAGYGTLQDANISIRFYRWNGPSDAVAASTGWTFPGTQTENYFAADMQRLLAQHGSLNGPTRSYVMGQILTRMLAMNPKVEIKVDLDDTIRPDKGLVQAKVDLVKVLAHEMGHAHGFVGHIVPTGVPGFADIGPWDVMQQRDYRGGGDRSFRFLESLPFFSLVQGYWELNAVDDAIGMIQNGFPCETEILGVYWPYYRKHEILGTGKSPVGKPQTQGPDEKEGCTDIIFSQGALLAYGIGQDIVGPVTVEEDGTTLHMSGNSWKAIPLQYDVTPDSFLEFSFRSPQQGDAHAIGFDLDLTGNGGRLFQLAGTERFANQDHNDYASHAPGWKEYQIPIGESYNGPIEYLCFVNDHDVESPDSESLFRDVRIVERPPESAMIDIWDTTITVYGTDDDDDFELARDDVVRVTINKNEYEFAPEEIKEFYFEGGEGYDRIMVRGSDESENLVAGPEETNMTAEGFMLATVGVEVGTFFGGGGVDTARLNGSNQADVLDAQTGHRHADASRGASVSE